MASNAWFFYSLGAAILWGASAAISEELLQRRGIPLPFLLFAETLVSFIFFAFLTQNMGLFKEGITSTFGNTQTLLLVLGMGLCFVGANYFILMGVTEKNATLASFIEISFPLFTIMFIWIFLGKLDLNLYSALGAILVLSGLGLIFAKG